MTTAHNIHWAIKRTTGDAREFPCTRLIRNGNERPITRQLLRSGWWRKGGRRISCASLCVLGGRHVWKMSHALKALTRKLNELCEREKVPGNYREYAADSGENKSSRQEDENDNIRAICPGEGEIDRRTGEEKCLCPRGERNKSQQSRKVVKYAIITSRIRKL